MHERTFGQFARVLVDIDISQPLRYKVLVERKGFAFFVELEYEHIPDFCTYCSVIGHHVSICKRNNKDVEAKTDREINLKKKSLSEPKKVFVQSKDGRSQQSKPLENVNADNEIINVEDSNEKSPPNEVIEKEPEIVVSPFQQQLSGNNEIVKSPRNAFREEDLQLEEELNANLIVENKNNLSDFENSTQGSFVDATQNQLLVNEDTSSVAAPLLTPVRVAKDMEFLKNSWANMADDDDDDDQRVLEDQGPTVDNPDAGFQLVLSKHQKKGQKRTTLSSRDSYTTRSKGSSKPFK
jgi:hypothetical protein